MTTEQTHNPSSVTIGPAGFFARFNWGWRIGIVYTCFVVFMLGMVYASTQMKTELVTADYYKEELNYQSHINKVNQTAKLSTQLKWKVGENEITYSFPAQVAADNIKANVYFYCPSNSKHDKVVKMETENGTSVLNTTALQKGTYQMKVEWIANGTEFFNEGFITIN